MRGLLNRPHTGGNDHNQYVRNSLGPELSSKLVKIINFDVKLILCSFSCVQ
jgi:hypothetical protein